MKLGKPREGLHRRGWQGNEKGYSSLPLAEGRAKKWETHPRGKSSSSADASSQKQRRRSEGMNDFRSSFKLPGAQKTAEAC